MLVIVAIILVAQPTLAISYVSLPSRDSTPDDNIVRRDCISAAPDINETAVIDGVCNGNSQNDFTTCSAQLTAYVGQVAASTCARYSQLYDECLATKSTDANCSDAKFGYQDCSKYVFQTYAYCSCYTSIPADLYSCVNNELNFKPGGSNPLTVLTWSIQPTLPQPSTIFSPSVTSPLRIGMQPSEPASFPPFATEAGVLPDPPAVPVAVPQTIVIDAVKVTSEPSSGAIPTRPNPAKGTRTEVVTITGTGTSTVTDCAVTATNCAPEYIYYTTIFTTTIFHCSDRNLIVAPTPSTVSARFSDSYVSTTVNVTLSTVYVPTSKMLRVVASPTGVVVGTVFNSNDSRRHEGSEGGTVSKRAIYKVW